MTCKAEADRKGLTELLITAVNAGSVTAGDLARADGSEKAMLDAWSMLHGIVAEYTDGGDQMAEECTCPQFSGSWEDHVGVTRDGQGLSFEDILKQHRSA